MAKNRDVFAKAFKYQFRAESLIGLPGVAWWDVKPMGKKFYVSVIFRSLLFAIGKKNLYRCALFGCIWTDACESKWGREL